MWASSAATRQYGTELHPLAITGWVYALCIVLTLFALMNARWREVTAELELLTNMWAANLLFLILLVIQIIEPKSAGPKPAFASGSRGLLPLLVLLVAIQLLLDNWLALLNRL